MRASTRYPITANGELYVHTALAKDLILDPNVL